MAGSPFRSVHLGGQLRGHLLEPPGAARSGRLARAGVVLCAGAGPGEKTSEAGQRGGECEALALALAEHLLPVGVALLWVDTSRTQDVRRAVEFMRTPGAGACDYVALWGRGPGGAAVLRLAAEDPSVAGILCQSAVVDNFWLAVPLQGLRQLMAHAAPSATAAAAGAVSSIGAGAFAAAAAAAAARFGALPLLQPPPAPARAPAGMPPSSGAEEGEALLEVAARCFAPALFIHGQEDTEVPPMHSQALHKAYVNAERHILLVPGMAQGTSLPRQVLAKGALRLARQMVSQEELEAIAAGRLPELKQAMERISMAAAGEQTRHTSDAEISALLRSDLSAARHRGMLQAAICAYPVLGPAADYVQEMGKEPLERLAEGQSTGELSDGASVRVQAVVALPAVESEVVLACVVPRRSCGAAGGVVYFAVVGSSMASVTAVRLLPQTDPSWREQQECEHPAVVATVAGLRASVETSAPVALQAPPVVLDFVATARRGAELRFASAACYAKGQGPAMLEGARPSRLDHSAFYEACDHSQASVWHACSSGVSADAGTSAWSAVSACAPRRRHGILRIGHVVRTMIPPLRPGQTAQFGASIDNAAFAERLCSASRSSQAAELGPGLHGVEEIVALLDSKETAEFGGTTDVADFAERSSSNRTRAAEFELALELHVGDSGLSLMSGCSVTPRQSGAYADSLVSGGSLLSRQSGAPGDGGRRLHSFAFSESDLNSAASFRSTLGNRCLGASLPDRDPSALWPENEPAPTQTTSRRLHSLAFSESDLGSAASLRSTFANRCLGASLLDRDPAALWPENELAPPQMISSLRYATPFLCPWACYQTWPLEQDKVTRRHGLCATWATPGQLGPV